MNPWALISLAASFIGFGTGIIVYQNKPGYSLNRIFALLCIFIAFYTFAEFGYLQAESYKSAGFWMKMRAIWAFPVSLSLHFTLLYIGKINKFSRAIIILSYFSAVVILILELATDIISAGPIKDAYGWTYTLPEEKICFYISSLWTIGIALTSTILIFFHYRQAIGKLARKQALLVLIGFVIPLVSTSIIDPLLLLSGFHIPDIFTLSLLIAVLFIGYAIKHHRLFYFDKGTATDGLIETMSNFLFLVDSFGTIECFNPAAMKLFGYSEEKIKGRNVNSFFTDKEWKKILKSKTENGVIYLNHVKNMEFTIRKKGKDRVPVLLSISPVKAGKVGAEGFIFVGSDLSNWEKYNKTLFESEERFRNLFEHAPDTIYICDTKGNLINGNRAAEEISGYKREELIGKNLFTSNLVSKTQLPGIFKMVADYKMGRKVTPLELTLNSRDGSKKQLEISAYPLREENRNIVINIGRDLTERKKMEQRLCKSEKRYRTVIENVGEGIAIVDKKGTFTFANHAAETIFGVPPGGLIGQSLEKFIDSGIFRIILEETKNRRQGSSGKYEIEIVHLVKGKRFVFVTASPMLNDDGSFFGLFGVFRDITEQKLDKIVLKDRCNFIEFVSKLSTDLIHLNTDETDFAIKKAISVVTQFVNLERGYIFSLTPDNKKLELTHEYCIEGVIPRKGVFESINVSDFTDFVDTLQRGEVIKIRSSKLPRNVETKKMTDILDFLEIKSFINLPLIVSDRFIGYIGFDSTLKEVDFSTEDIKAFSLTGQMIANVMERRRIENEISLALKEKDVLLEEIHHRVKNNLQIISSILNMQIHSIKDKDASVVLKESRDRVFSMSLIHETLYQSEKNAVINVREYIEKLSVNLFHSYSIIDKRIDLEINVNKVYLNINQAIPCGLILNELISNSLKHAFKDGRKGMINIELSIDNFGQITFIYYDNGIAFPQDIDIKGSETLGFRLVNTLVRQLDATLDFDYSNEKTFVIKFSKQKIDHETEV